MLGEDKKSKEQNCWELGHEQVLVSHPVSSVAELGATSWLPQTTPGLVVGRGPLHWMELFSQAAGIFAKELME